MSGQSASAYRLGQARRPEQEEPEPVEEFADQALAVAAGREIIRETTWRGEGPNYVEVRSWGGCLVPTDDVIAHLTMMRRDEADFWRHANQHSPSSPEAGL